MAKAHKNIAKNSIIEQIMLEINEVPLVYLKTLYAIIYSFKENIVTIQPTQIPLPISESVSEEDNFDWDSLLNDIQSNRKKNNMLIHNRLPELISSPHLFQNYKS